MAGRWVRPSRLYLVASMVLAVAAGAVVHGYAGRVAAAAGRPGAPAIVAVASRDIPRGTRLAPSDVRLVTVPRPYVQPGAVRSIQQAAGRVVLADLSTGEAVTETRLARVRAGPVASLIPAGLRAFAVPTSLPSGTLAPGDRVDVLATFTSGQPHTEQVVEAVEVLFVLSTGPTGTSAGEGGLSLDAGAAGVGTPGTLILLVSPDQEERLAYARAFANLEVVIAPME